MFFKNVMGAFVCAVCLCQNLCAQNDLPEYDNPIYAIRSPHLSLVRFRPGDGHLENQLHQVISQEYGYPISASELSRDVLGLTYSSTPFFSLWLIYGGQKPTNAIGYSLIKPLNSEVVGVLVSQLKAAETAEFDRLMTAFVRRYVGKMLINVNVFDDLWRQSGKTLLYSSEIEKAKKDFLATHMREPSFTPNVLIFASVQGFVPSQAKVCKLAEPSQMLDINLSGPGRDGLVHYVNDFKGDKNCIYDLVGLTFEVNHSSPPMLNASSWLQPIDMTNIATVAIAMVFSYRYGRSLLGILSRLIGNMDGN
jgi:hypothetical protein